MRLEDYKIEPRYSARLVASTRITAEESDEEVRELVLEINSPNFAFEIGQCVGVLLPGPTHDGNREHFRLYSIANTPWEALAQNPMISLCVKRCSYIDDFSGEEYRGISSNYLCDLKPGDTITVTGPYGIPFEVPDDKESDLLLIGLGTGIAPFRAFVTHIYRDIGGWTGKIRLFYGAKTGLEMLYMNDKRDDFANYYDEQTFEAFKALSPRPHWAEPVALDRLLEERKKEIWPIVCDPKTHVYIAGFESIRDMLDKAFASMAGSTEKWERRKAELVAGKRWVELVY
ncbi:MAG: FAD-binding oxidoreductase [Gammaproteobacteria bacterium]